MKNEDRIEYLERQFNKYYAAAREASSCLFDIAYGYPESVQQEEKSFAEYWTHEYLFRMYNILCVYLETMRLPDYLATFKQQFETIVNDKTESVKISSVLLQYGDSDEDLELLIEWKKFLAPFNFFWDEQEEKKSRKILEFLECTNEIIKLTHTKVYKEDSINSIIREVAKLYYSEVIPFSEGYFVHRFKSYKPDVIIKEIRTAIEYKLIRENSEVGIKLDELIIDARRYTGNHNNRECIAVFCLSHSVSKTKKEIREDWDNMNFPSNWKLVIISDVKVEVKKADVSLEN